MWENPKQFHNPKSEAANPKHPQDSKSKCFKGSRATVLDLRFRSLEFVSDLGFQIRI